MVWRMACQRRAFCIAVRPALPCVRCIARAHLFCSAIGDAKLKQWVIGKPDVTVHDLTDDCEYLILACDGMWDVMDNDTVSPVNADVVPLFSHE